MESSYVFVNEGGNREFDEAYDSACSFRQGLALVRKAGKAFILSRAGECEPLACSVDNPFGLFSENLAPVKIGDSYGFVDSGGDLAITPKFDRVAGFREGLAPARQNGKAGFIDPLGDWAIKPDFDHVGCFFDGRAEVEIGEQSYFIDRTGDVKLGPFTVINCGFNSGIAVAEDEDGTIVFNTDGTEVFRSSSDFGLWSVNEDSFVYKSSATEAKAFSKNGDELFQLECDDLNSPHEGLCKFGKDGKEGFVDGKTGEVIIEPRLSGCSDFQEGYAVELFGKKPATVWRKDGTVAFNATPFIILQCFSDGLCLCRAGS
ncbi:MAG: WG repeat-containing protein [Verrucomicrobiota bacterium]